MSKKTRIITRSRYSAQISHGKENAIGGVLRCNFLLRVSVICPFARARVGV
jgi:hypothetical protein